MDYTERSAQSNIAICRGLIECAGCFFRRPSCPIYFLSLLSRTFFTRRKNAMSISFVRTALLAGLVCLSAACSSLDSSMKRYVGKPINIVYERYGRAPDTV